MGLMPQKYPRVKANVWLFCMQVREVKVWLAAVFLAKSTDGDYHQEMNSVVFLEWFKNQLMPALKNPSLAVLDNACYHNAKTEDTVCPNFSQKKAVLQNYLTQYNIPFSATDTKRYYMKK